MSLGSLYVPREVDLADKSRAVFSGFCPRPPPAGQYVIITFYLGPTCTREDAAEGGKLASPVNTRVAVIFCSGKGRPAAPVLEELDANKDFAFLLSRLVHHV